MLTFLRFSSLFSVGSKIDPICTFAFIGRGQVLVKSPCALSIAKTGRLYWRHKHFNLVKKKGKNAIRECLFPNSYFLLVSSLLWYRKSPQMHRYFSIKYISRKTQNSLINKSYITFHGSVSVFYFPHSSSLYLSSFLVFFFIPKEASFAHTHSIFIWSAWSVSCTRIIGL